MIEDLIKKLRKSPYTVEHTSFDEYIFKDVQKYEGFKKAYEIDYPLVKELVFDTFNLFFKTYPKFLEDERIDPRFLVNKKILEKATNTEEYDKMRSFTVMDEVNSAIATTTFVQTVIKEILERNPKFASEVEDIINDFNELTNLHLQLPKASGKAKEKIEQKVSEIENRMNQKIESLNIPQIAVSKAIREASETAKNAMQAMENMFGWGTETGTPTKVSAEERIKLANLLVKNRKVFEFAKMLGKIRNVRISTQKSKIRRPVSEIYEVTIGSDIERVLPYEAAKLSDPVTEIDFFKRFAEGQLMVYSLRDKEKLGSGDFVACIDISGSMSGEKEIWAKAVALACMEIAMKKNRRFSIVMFDYDVQYVKTFERKPSLDEIVEFVEFFSGGGTNFEKPLNEARRIIEEGMPKADILFISDGQCDVSEAWLEEFLDFKKKTKTRVVSVHIKGWGYEVLEKFSDHVERVENLVTDSAKIFQYY